MHAYAHKDIRLNSSEHLQDALARSNSLLTQQKSDNNAVQDNISKADIANTNTLATNQQTAPQNNFAQSATSTLNSTVSQVIGQAQASRENAITTPTSESAGSIGTMSTENFIKFQSILDNAQSAAKSTTNTSLNSPSEIMAQIKFGLGGKGKDESNISIQLHPKELGKVDITMQMAADGKTHVTVIAENTDTLNLLQKEADSLKGMLTDALKTDSSNLNFSFHQGGSDGWKQQFANNQYSGGNRTNSADGVASSNDLPAQSYRYNMIATDGLDIRV